MLTGWVARYKFLHEPDRRAASPTESAERIGFLRIRPHVRRERDLPVFHESLQLGKKESEKILMIRIAASGASEGTHDSRRASPRLA